MHSTVVASLLLVLCALLLVACGAAGGCKPSGRHAGLQLHERGVQVPQGHVSLRRRLLESHIKDPVRRASVPLQRRLQKQALQSQEASRRGSQTHRLKVRLLIVAFASMRTRVLSSPSSTRSSMELPSVAPLQGVAW